MTDQPAETTHDDQDHPDVEVEGGERDDTTNVVLGDVNITGQDNRPDDQADDQADDDRTDDDDGTDTTA